MDGRRRRLFETFFFISFTGGPDDLIRAPFAGPTVVDQTTSSWLIVI